MVLTGDFQASACGACTRAGARGDAAVAHRDHRSARAGTRAPALATTSQRFAPQRRGSLPLLKRIRRDSPSRPTSTTDSRSPDVERPLTFTARAVASASPAPTNPSTYPRLTKH